MRKTHKDGLHKDEFLFILSLSLSLSSLSLFLSRSLSLSLSYAHTHSLSLSPVISVSLSLYISILCFFSLSLSLSLSRALSLSLVILATTAYNAQSSSDRTKERKLNVKPGLKKSNARSNESGHVIPEASNGNPNLHQAHVEHPRVHM